jgi:hypothetical protein
MTKVRVTKLRPFHPWPTWVADFMVGGDGNYERRVQFFHTWQDAYTFAYTYQRQVRKRHLERVKKTNCGCMWCK